MTLKELGLEVEDYLRYIRGEDMDADKERLIEKYWDELIIVDNEADV